MSHPNLLDIYDVGATDGIHYAVTELLEGDTLRERITPTGLPWQKVTQIGAAVADGLAAAHGRGIIHRDIKPENLFLTADGRVKILDFGLAAVHEEASPDARTATITEAGTVMGTPGYMAPEQVKGQPADARSDIFSLGCVIYEMASGHRAFGGDTGAEVIAAILKEEPPQLSSSGAAVPVDLERAVHRCLEKRPEARFQSAADLAYSLKSVGLSGIAPVMATPGSGTGVTTRKKFSLPQIGTAAILVILAAIIAWRVLFPGGDQAPASSPPSISTPTASRWCPSPTAPATPPSTTSASRRRPIAHPGLAELEEIEVVPPAWWRRPPAGGSVNIDTRSLVGRSRPRRRPGWSSPGCRTPSATGLELQATLEDASKDCRPSLRAAIPDRSEPAPQACHRHPSDWTLMAVQDHLHPSLAWGAGDDLPSLETYREFRRRLPIGGQGQLRAVFRPHRKRPELHPAAAHARGGVSQWLGDPGGRGVTQGRGFQ